MSQCNPIRKRKDVYKEIFIYKKNITKRQLFGLLLHTVKQIISFAALTRSWHERLAKKSCKRWFGQCLFFVYLWDSVSVSICYIQCTGCLLTNGNIQGSRGEYGGLRGSIEESQESSQASVQIVPTYSRLQMFPLQNSFCKKAAMYCIVLTHFNIFF